MIATLSQAFHQAEKLPITEQKILAEWMLELLQSEKQWDELFASSRSQDVLSQLADEALEEFHAGNTELLDVHTL